MLWDADNPCNYWLQFTEASHVLIDVQPGARAADLAINSSRPLGENLRLNIFDTLCVHHTYLSIVEPGEQETGAKGQVVVSQRELRVHHGQRTHTLIRDFRFP